MFRHSELRISGPLCERANKVRIVVTVRGLSDGNGRKVFGKHVRTNTQGFTKVVGRFISIITGVLMWGGGGTRGGLWGGRRGRAGRSASLGALGLREQEAAPHRADGELPAQRGGPAGEPPEHPTGEGGPRGCGGLVLDALPGSLRVELREPGGAPPHPLREPRGAGLDGPAGSGRTRGGAQRGRGPGRLLHPAAPERPGGSSLPGPGGSELLRGGAPG